MGTVCPTAGTEIVISPVSVPWADTSTPSVPRRWTPVRVPVAVISSCCSPCARSPERRYLLLVSSGMASPAPVSSLLAARYTVTELSVPVNASDTSG